MFFTFCFCFRNRVFFRFLEIVFFFSKSRFSVILSRNRFFFVFFYAKSRFFRVFLREIACTEWDAKKSRFSRKNRVFSVKNIKIVVPKLKML